MPNICSLADFIERRIRDVEEAALFKVGGGDPPAVLEVLVEPVGENVP